MPTTEQLRNRLQNKLWELFQLDQPDLDFGFYRIMHARAAEVQQFIGTDLLKTVSNAFDTGGQERRAELEAAYQRALETARKYGAPNPEEAEAVKEARAELDQLKDTTSAEAEVYDHLYRFFERYYENGDFISRRYYTRESSGKAAPYAIPYNGEEVKLHWANADQYYVKSTEHFSNFTFDITQASIFRDMSSEERNIKSIPSSPLRVHFQIASATEGEHGNIKSTDATKRAFFLHRSNPVYFNEVKELVVNFEYRPARPQDELGKADEDELKQRFGAKNKGDLPNLGITAGIIDAVKELGSVAETYLHLFNSDASTDAVKNRPLLARYVNQYTSRNTMDYFIHKDLGGFLRRELDFYIKNEVMRLDDIEDADAPAVESYLSKIKVLRQIASKLIDFLAQLEEFQKRLWLKKKFVVETNYCITLDRVPEELYPEIISNQAQLDEWVELFAIHEINADLARPGFSNPLTTEFLKANEKLVLDTRFFDQSFKNRLLNSIDDIDTQCEGLLVHSENFQAMNLLERRYREQFQLIYGDPPYNTELDRETGAFLYKDSYASSTWATLTSNRFELVQHLLSPTGCVFVSIDDNEVATLRLILDEMFGRENLVSVIAVKSRDSVSSDHKVSLNHNYLVVYAKDSAKLDFGGFLLDPNDYSNPDSDPRGPWRPVPLDANKPGGDTKYGITNPNTREVYFPPNGRSWAINRESFQKLFEDNRISFGVQGTSAPKKKLFYEERIQRGDRATPISFWKDCETTQRGTRQVMDLFGQKKFSYPKPVGLMVDLLTIGSLQPNPRILDFFAGSGTTGHAVIQLNRSDEGKRNYVLVEMGDHFDSVLKPRIAKVVYAPNWSSGAPTQRESGISQCIKYIRLESYEDTLHNLVAPAKPFGNQSHTASLKRDYMLRYMLDMEYSGSQSLLNIDAFRDPSNYKLEVKEPGRDGYAPRSVDLLETFNYLIGLRVQRIFAPESFNATFRRETDPELPQDQQTRLAVNGRLMQDAEGPWWFRMVEGWLPKDPANPNNGLREKILIIWRKLTDDIEKDNVVLDTWLENKRINARDFEFDTIYVNGSNNLPIIKRDSENWKVRLTEEEFMKRMWDVEVGQ